ncbi:Rz1-like lysis system protein LysC [Xenorhabdus littoralis]|uniref:Rz1-like lysis system protein LysC n=1 Tax=Xenorhabdus littoralis TaxID=2582835 RepID=UPI003F6B520F
MIALTALFLTGLLSGCSNTRTEYVQVPPIPIPAHLLADCLLPVIPDTITWSDSLMLNGQLRLLSFPRAVAWTSVSRCRKIRCGI